MIEKEVAIQFLIDKKRKLVKNFQTDIFSIETTGEYRAYKTDENYFKALALSKGIDVIIKELEYADKMHNLEEELGCPLEACAWLIKNKPILVINPIDKTIQEIKKPIYHFEPSRLVFDIRNEEFKSTYKNHIWNTGGVIIPLKDYKKTWWLKADRSE